jgi:hypothetical protein
MKRDITEEVTRAADVPSRLKCLDKLMKYKDKELYKNRNRKGKKGRYENEDK